MIRIAIIMESLFMEAPKYILILSHGYECQINMRYCFHDELRALYETRLSESTKNLVSVSSISKKFCLVQVSVSSSLILSQKKTFTTLQSLRSVKNVKKSYSATEFLFICNKIFHRCSPDFIFYKIDCFLCKFSNFSNKNIVKKTLTRQKLRLSACIVCGLGILHNILQNISSRFTFFREQNETRKMSRSCEALAGLLVMRICFQYEDVIQS